MTIKNILSKIYVHPSCYLFLLLAVLSSNFIPVIITSLLLLIHEMGHFFTAYIFKWPTDKITFYPFGGVSKFYHDVNSPLKEELIVLIMGPLVQVIFYFIIINSSFLFCYRDLISIIHYNILLFNLLPIYPLDGGRIVQCLICYLTSYNLSFKVIYLISYIFLLYFIISFIFKPSINLLIIILLLFIKLISEYKNIKYYLERFILERYLHNYRFKRSTIVNSSTNFKRDCYHLVKDNKKYLLEEEYLKKKYG